MVESGRKLIINFDCTLNYNEEVYFGHPDVKIIETKTCKYREAGAVPNSRFGYRFKINNLGIPHSAVIHFPHDKRRFMLVMDGTSYDLTTGLFTGFVQPVTGKMDISEIIFWPRWIDCSITFLTWGEGEPAAVSQIEIYELGILPPFKTCKLDSSSMRSPTIFRQFGIQYEDPCGATASEGALSHQEWGERLITYAKHTGQSMIMYPMAWYHGPLYPSECEISDYGDIFVAPDRTQYIRWVTQPEDWYAPFFKRLEDEGLFFKGILTLLRLSSLMKQMNINLKEIYRGAPTINNMLWNNQVQGATGDWTGIHNLINYNAIAKKMKVGEPWPGFHMPKGESLAYGEHRNRGVHGGSIFNPLHPIVQDAILIYIKELGEKYQTYSAFKGISINMYASCLLWFGSLHSGYDDFTLQSFQQETGIKIPTKPKDKRRFEKRYEILVKKHYDAWVSWRCNKIFQLVCKIRDLLQKIRDDYTLTITIWDETFFFPILGQIGAAHQYKTRPSNLQFYKEAGFDPALYANEPGIFVDITQGVTRDRGGHPPFSTGGINTPAEYSSMYRDFTFLDSDMLNAMSQNPNSGAFIFNCWVESWGKHEWYLPEPNDANVEKYRNIDGKPAENILRINSVYPIDGFWWDSQLRIVPTFPAGDYFLEPYCHALAEFDAKRITAGGLFLDTAHTYQIREFNCVFTQLPAITFEDVEGVKDPVAIRSAVIDGKRYLYAVNREYYAVSIKIYFDNPISQLDQIGVKSNESSSSHLNKNCLEYTLKGYELAGWILQDLNTVPKKAEFSLSSEIIDFLKIEMDRVHKAILNQKKKRSRIPGIDWLEGEILDMWQHRRYSRLRQLLTSYISRKCLELK